MQIYSTGALVRVVNSLDVPAPFLLDRYFRLRQQSTDQRIYFDKKDGKRRLAPFVSPLVEGKVMESRGYKTDSFEAPYLKPKSDIDPNKQFRRRAGEAIGGSLSPAERRDLAVAQALEEHLEAIQERENVMAAEVLRTGKLTIEGEGYGLVVLDFGRDPALTVTLAGADKWTDGGGDPVGDIEAWAALIQAKSGAVVTDVVLEPSAWAHARQNAAVQKILDTRRGSTSTAETGPLAATKARFVGTLGSFDIWTYQDRYVDDAGADKLIMPIGSVIMAGPDLEGTLGYAAIRDPRAGFAPLSRFPKMWIDEDPAMEWLMTQSAPLTVPYRVDASLSATVL
jgi:hypothetical protein